MALTQTATIPGPGPLWDEEVVPALRKRLESESRTIARRISAISVTSVDDSANATFATDYTYREQSSTGSPYQGSSASARPRPSLQQSRTSTDTGSSRGTPSKPPTTRARTYSQPWSVDGRVNGRSNGSTPSRATSPRQDPRPTRIPKPARSRAGSTSSHNYTLNGQSFTQHDSPQAEAELWVLHEKPAATASRSTISVSSRQDSGLLQEPAPFQAGSTTSSNDHSSYDKTRTMEFDPPRPSVDSEERPYEHWYRGEVSRNGGVGELKVAKRKEMLDIANYGHALRSRQAEAQRRRRADSVGPTNRQSFYMEDDGAGQVKDEHPLTDFEGDASDNGNASDHTVYPYQASASSPKLSMYPSRSMTPNSYLPYSRQQQSRIPTPTRQVSESPRSHTPPTQVVRGASEPPSFPSSSTPKPAPRRAASPTTSAAAKSRTQASKATRAKAEAAKKQRDEAVNRRSVAHYPMSEDDLRDAIPEWTQPVPREGNWDEVVLPVVARKKGLNGHYERADGSPRVKQTQNVVAPAPGTFGYDHSKYRPPRAGDPESLQMDEFGRPTNQDDIEEAEVEEPRRVIATAPSGHDRTVLPVRGPGPPSPGPFSHYAPNKTIKLEPVSNGPVKMEVDLARVRDDDEDSGGCCKCVVM